MMKNAGNDPLFTLTTGPVDAYPAVLRALSMPVWYDYDPAFLACFERVSRKAAAAMRTESIPLILQGEPVLALEAAAASLIARHDVVLNLVSGVYGAGFGDWAGRYCATVRELAVAYNEALDPAVVDRELRRHPEIGIVCLCHHDTPSGTLNPVDEIGCVVKRHGRLFLVDAVSSFGGMAVTPDSCRADIFITGPNKCLGCPPSLSLVAVSEGGWRKIKANPDAPRASVLSLLDWERAWLADEPFPYTPSVAEINGLEAALDGYLGEGPEQVWARHDLTARAFRAGLRAMGLSLWAARESIASPTATAIRVPEGVDEAQWRALAREHYGVMFSSGRGETLGKVMRVGHMGPTARPLYAVVALTALGGALNRLRAGRVDVGTGVNAAMAVIG
ncbi:pyridoxamine--pyruvate transaminase [Acerihabitans arboris]|uniref:Aminotransferase class V-fold PLP-dependent enzyme n=1 Tax=Acerihabitans arboris TaxID=2691583 RepID=A0A845SKK6_9GAMM|nr:alanine--glyoxylate aminotransferase family protein [Acerihabitans arboris]NDL65450.1 aminotransferase class V-fold PLP-dependent enzyme [Acerihabitans arboris]